ncbi:pyridoxal phosphate-dependent aminotransferase [Flavobacterium sp. CS20]|uniref:pyridoxal phosphate-dependent aminotransferase n=1 Tax=Flavobacterium sp. CS20 TaxID=2775246 RepID=UPI001B3A4122|nr:aminotransferase class I/II-fold pyridoxal phosphate-dependent enzyme [Flavobacterium sp. CS20]QTY25858.1 aminotransferase class I/II-fold pyridoxal phosphate-dependent enzyme [Flavobacterium sp. CS20]
MIQPAERLAQIKEYYFSKKLKEVKRLIDDGNPIINLGIGSPDINPPESVVESLIKATADEKAHQYQAYAGIPSLREAIKTFYDKTYQVKLSKDNQILPLIGSKEGIMHISMAFLNPGDDVLVPNPGYPTYLAVSGLVQAKTLYYDLKENQNWQPDIERLSKLITPKTKLMWINYPHMPTGAKADDDTINNLIEFTKQNHILLVNDNPYSLILNDKPFSILKHRWPNNHVLELNSLSKTFNLSGWRVGMLCGHQDLIQQVVKVKSNMDSGMFYPIQKGGEKALQLSSKWYQYLNAIYTKRRDLVWQICNQLDLKYNKNNSGLFVWAKIQSQLSAKTLSDILLHDYHIFVTPGDVFGSNGQGYLRFSLCVNQDELKTCLERTKHFKA